MAILCVGYRLDFSWIHVAGLDHNPRNWFKHCFPPGLGDKLMFVGLARPHQGAIPACAELLSRCAASLISNRCTLPADYAQRAQHKAAAENGFYRHAHHQPILVDYPSLMESVARLVGCNPKPPSVTEPVKLVKYWLYPDCSFWYRQTGPDAVPHCLDSVLARFPLRRALNPHPMFALALCASLLHVGVSALLPRRIRGKAAWYLQPKKAILHGNG